MSFSEIPVIMLDAQQKSFVKAKLLQVTSCLEYWQHRYDETFSPEKPTSISSIKKNILNGSLEQTFPMIVDAKSLLDSFINDHIDSLGGPIEYIVICSFSANCRSIARNRSIKLSADLNIDAQSIYEDLLQDAYASVHHAMYYFTKSDLQLSTFILGSVKRSIERCSRYNYSKFSPMSPEDTHDTYSCRVAMMENLNLTVEEIAEEVGIASSRAEEVLSHMTKVVRVAQKHSSDNETSFDLLSQIAAKSSLIEDVDNVDTVDFLKKIFDETDQTILSLSKEEKDTLNAAFSHNFEWGWQSSFANNYINHSTGKPYTRARIGQFLSSALGKIKTFFLEAA